MHMSKSCGHDSLHDWLEFLIGTLKQKCYSNCQISKSLIPSMRVSVTSDKSDSFAFLSHTGLTFNCISRVLSNTTSSQLVPCWGKSLVSFSKSETTLQHKISPVNAVSGVHWTYRPFNWHLVKGTPLASLIRTPGQSAQNQTGIPHQHPPH